MSRNTANESLSFALRKTTVAPGLSPFLPIQLDLVLPLCALGGLSVRMRSISSTKHPWSEMLRYPQIRVARRRKGRPITGIACELLASGSHSRSSGKDVFRF